MDHRAIAGRFNAWLGRRFRTLLVGGAAEPLYLPPSGRQPAMIRYTGDHAQSVLHELSHWCLADPRRRAQVDYGLWYQPPPRSERDQARFYAAEVPVQGLEMLLALVCGLPFHFSADNPGADGGRARQAFERRVRNEFSRRCVEPAPAEPVRSVLAALAPDWRDRLPAALPRGAVAAG